MQTKEEIHQIEFKKHRFDVDIVDAYFRVIKILDNQSAKSSSINPEGLKELVALQIEDAGYDAEEILRLRLPVVLSTSSSVKSFYWWLGLSLAVEDPALINFRLDHLCLEEKANYPGFLKALEIQVIDFIKKHNLPGSDVIRMKVSDWIYWKLNPVSKVNIITIEPVPIEINDFSIEVDDINENIQGNEEAVIIIDEKRKLPDEIRLIVGGAPVLLMKLKGFVNGVYPEGSDDTNKNDYSDLLLDALRGKELTQKIILKLNQAEIGRLFLGFKEDDKIILNNNKSLSRWLIKTFRYTKSNGESAPLTNKLYKEYLVG